MLQLYTNAHKTGQNGNSQAAFLRFFKKNHKLGFYKKIHT